MDEIWRDVKGYEGLYQVSNLGNFKRTVKTNAYTRGYRVAKNGYKTVSLSKNGIYKQEYLHRLVAESFIPNTDGKPTVDHINRDKLDNRVENLRWATYKEQRKNQTSGDTKIIAINIHSGDKIKFNSQHECSRVLGLRQPNINRCLKGLRKTLGGYRFEYVK